MGEMCRRTVYRSGVSKGGRITRFPCSQANGHGRYIYSLPANMLRALFIMIRIVCVLAFCIHYLLTLCKANHHRMIPCVFNAKEGETPFRFPSLYIRFPFTSPARGFRSRSGTSFPDTSPSRYTRRRLPLRPRPSCRARRRSRHTARCPRHR